MRKPAQIQEFKPGDYFGWEKDFDIEKDPNDPFSNIVIKPFQKGLELVVQYYTKKYGVKISLPQTPWDRYYLKCIDFTGFAENFRSYLPKSINKLDSYRHAFFLPVIGHAIPLIFIKECGEEAFLLADSLGMLNSGNKSYRLLEEINKYSNINVYPIMLVRQSDVLSCFIDAMIFCRDATRINRSTGQYYIPNLLQRLKARAEKKDDIYFTKLPNELLKTAQISKFVEQHREDQKATTEKQYKFHNKQFNLDKFRERYSASVTFKEFDYDLLAYLKYSKMASVYLIKKGIRLVHIIEIQFYLNQIQSIFTLTDSIEAYFICCAKKILCEKRVKEALSNSSIFEFTKEFASQHENGMAVNGRENSLNISLFGSGSLAKSAKIWKEKGNGHFMKKQFENALMCYKNAITVSPTPFKEALFNKGLILLKLNQKQNALATLREAVKIDPSYDKAVFHIASTHLSLGNYSEAEDAVNDYIDAGGTNAKITSLLSKRLSYA